MATLALNSGLWVRRLLMGGSHHQGWYPYSEVNDGTCPEKSVHLTLVIEALNRALGQHQVNVEQLLIQTDQGSQYRATNYIELLKKYQIRCSMSAKGCCWVNTVVESFFSTLNLQLTLDDNCKELLDPKEQQRDLAFWIDGYYIGEPRHSTISNLSPIDYEQQFAVTHALTQTGV
jgi:putative transposase